MDRSLGYHGADGPLGSRVHQRDRHAVIYLVAAGIGDHHAGPVDGPRRPDDGHVVPVEIGHCLAEHHREVHQRGAGPVGLPRRLIDCNLRRRQRILYDFRGIAVAGVRVGANDRLECGLGLRSLLAGPAVEVTVAEVRRRHRRGVDLVVERLRVAGIPSQLLRQPAPVDDIVRSQGDGRATGCIRVEHQGLSVGVFHQRQRRGVTRTEMHFLDCIVDPDQHRAGRERGVDHARARLRRRGVEVFCPLVGIGWPPENCHVGHPQPSGVIPGALGIPEYGTTTNNFTHRLHGGLSAIFGGLRHEVEFHVRRRRNGRGDVTCGNDHQFRRLPDVERTVEDVLVARHVLFGEEIRDVNRLFGQHALVVVGRNRIAIRGDGGPDRSRRLAHDHEGTRPRKLQRFAVGEAVVDVASARC